VAVWSGYWWVVEQSREGDSGGLGGGCVRDLCNLFRIIKWKHMLMEADMTGNINTMRCNVKTSITKVRGTVTKEHTWRGTEIQFMIIIWT
jgi:hypothetical protein